MKFKSKGRIVLINIVILITSFLFFFAVNNYLCFNTKKENNCFKINSNIAINETNVMHDIKNGSESFYYLENGLQALGSNLTTYNANIDNNETCNSITSSHGNGREFGYQDNFLGIGCGNYKAYSYNYGSTDIPYYLDMTTMTDDLANKVRSQLEMWNSVVMHDGTGQFINFYEVTSLNSINGRPVIKVIQIVLDDAAGSFDHEDENAPIVKLDPNMNADTPLHEFGHVLGLADLDESSSDVRQHSVLMGYNRNTMESTINEAIKYQDIQGAAVINNQHTDHQFTRYVVNGEDYVHICFYCDMMSVQSSIMPESSPMVYAYNCRHNYERLVSAGDRHWFKCTKCYKVIESDYAIDVKADLSVEISELLNKSKAVISIPIEIGGQTVTSIGPSAFANQTQITSVTLPETITSIGDMAFSGCTYLSDINIPISVSNIGVGVFNGCHNLNINISGLNDNFEIEDNILYNESKTKILAAGETPSEITIPATVNEIEDYAFNGNLNLHTVRIYGSPSIGVNAFYECANLDNVYFYSFTVPEVVSGAFANNFFTAHVPYNLQNTYSELFNEERIDVVPIPITATLMVDDITYQTINTYYGETISFIEPTKDGYTFAHWVDEQGNVYENGGVWDRAENLIVQAVWEPKGYAINFAGYGSTNLESKFVLYGMPIGELPTPTRTGYTFNGWKDENGVFYTADTVWLSTSSLTLTSDFSANQYTITYDGNGGTASIVTQNVYYLSVVDSLATATKLGFTFTGWNTQADGLGATIVAPYTYETANNVILYAQYTANVHGVSFDKQGGTGGSDGVNAIYNSAMPTATAPMKTGYTFNGYYSEPNGLGTKYYNIDMTSANVWDNDSNTTLYADWVANTYDVVLDMQGGSGGTVNILATYASAMPTATAPTRTGYTFNGYYSMPNGLGTKYYHLDMASANIWNVAENTTLYANWTANTYTITFDTQGGSGGTVSTTATYDSAMPSAIAPTKVGYTFFGYFTSPNGAGTQIYNEFMVSSRVWDITSNTTLYAFWVPIQYEIVFNTAGGSGGTSSILASYGCAMPTATAPTKTGYVFLGYYTSPEGAGVKYYEADMSSARNWDITSGTTLYAHWRGQYFNINYKNLIFLDHTADVILDGNETKDAPTYFEYGKGFNLNRATASWQKNDGVLVFLGWYTNMNFTTKVTTISATRKAPIDVYAKWRYDFNRNSRYGAYYITDEDPYTEEYRDTITLELNINNLYQELTSIGINYVYLEFKLKIREVDDGYQEVMIYKSTSPTSNPIWIVDDINHGPTGKDTTAKYYIWECAFSIDDLRDCRYLYVRYGANGAWGDDWVTDEIHVDVMYTVSANSEENVKPFSWDYNVPVADTSCTPLESVSESY